MLLSRYKTRWGTCFGGAPGRYLSPRRNNATSFCGRAWTRVRRFGSDCDEGDDGIVLNTEISDEGLLVCYMLAKPTSLPKYIRRRHRQKASGVGQVPRHCFRFQNSEFNTNHNHCGIRRGFEVGFSESYDDLNRDIQQSMASKMLR